MKCKLLSLKFNNKILLIFIFFISFNFIFVQDNLVEINNHVIISDLLSDPILNNKKISLESEPVKVQDLIALISKISNIDFVIDNNVTGNSGKLSFNNVTPGYILNFILSHNNPQLSLIKEMGIYQVVLKTKIQEIEKNNDFLVSKTFKINFATMNDKFKELTEKMWENIIGEKKSISSLYIDFDRKKIYVKSNLKIINEFKNFLSEIDCPVNQIRLDVILVFAQKDFNFDFGINWSGIYNRANTIKSQKIPFGFYGLGGVLKDFPEPTKPIDERHGNLYVDPSNFGLNLFTKIFRKPCRDDELDYNSETSESFIKIPFVFGGKDLNLRRLNLLLNAAESESKIKIVSRPSVVTSDNEMAKILIGKSIPIYSTNINISSTAVQNATSINYQDIGIVLEILPIISPNKKIIKLDISLEESEIIAGRIKANDKGVMTDPPVKKMIKVKNKVELKNGQTIVIGGLSSYDERIGKNEVPYVNKLPLIGKLFKSSSNAKQEVEQYVFITPRIIE